MSSVVDFPFTLPTFPLDPNQIRSLFDFLGSCSRFLFLIQNASAALASRKMRYYYFGRRKANEANDRDSIAHIERYAASLATWTPFSFPLSGRCALSLLTLVHLWFTISRFFKLEVTTSF